MNYPYSERGGIQRWAGVGHLPTTITTLTIAKVCAEQPVMPYEPITIDHGSLEITGQQSDYKPTGVYQTATICRS